MIKQQRLDEFLIEEGFTADKKSAFIIVTEGRVLIKGQKAVSPAQLVANTNDVVVRKGRGYVGRGALKLEGAISKFGVVAKDKICADIGSATGGFTEILLAAGAKKVYAIDTARGKLVPKLRDDPRVVVMEGTDVRDLTALPERIELASIDVSLIPLEGILPAVRKLLAPNAQVVALLKPQYQTRDVHILRHGIVQDDSAREKILHDFIAYVNSSGWRVAQWMESPIRGGKGNVEYLVLLDPA